MDTKDVPVSGVLSRSSLLALYASPLVPNKLEGMKELSEWYGEYSTPPSPPIQRSQLSSSRQNSSSAVPQSSSVNALNSSSHRRLTPFNSDANPFANFGRFGVDGGLMGEPLEMPRRRGGKNGPPGIDTGESLGGAGGGGKDLAPHLQLGGGGARKALQGGGVRDDVVPPWASEGASKRDNHSKEERTYRSSASRSGESPSLEPRRTPRGLNGNGGLGGESTPNGKDRRGLGPADEGGWRSVGTTREEREKRLLRNQGATNANYSSTDSPRRFDRDRRDNHTFERGDRGERDTHARGGGGRGGPAWMNDEDSSSSPSWMETSAAAANNKVAKEGKLNELGDGDRNDDELLDVSTPTKKHTDWQATTGGSGGMDSIQQWKAQMKEMEKKERERDLRDAGIEPQSQPQQSESVFSALTSPKPEPASAKSIFEDLGIIRSPAVTPAAPPGLNIGGAQSQGDSAATEQPGGRGSRFAKFFDGKPQSPVPQAQQPAPSVFGALMGSASGTSTNTNATMTAGPAGSGPSKEDSDSMARLLGMLQIQGTRSGSPADNRLPTAGLSASGLASPSPAPSSIAAQPPTPVPQAAAGESRSSSRFKFSNSAARASSPSVGSRSVPPSQPASAVHSPTASSQSIPPPLPASYGSYNAQLPHALPSQQSATTAAGDRLRSPPLPVPQSHQSGTSYHPRTLSSTSDIANRSLPASHQLPLPASSISPLPPTGQSMKHSHQQQQQQQQGQYQGITPVPPPSVFPSQFYGNNPSNGHRVGGTNVPPPPPPAMGMFPMSGPGGQSIPPQMVTPEMLRSLAAASNGMRSPPLSGHAQPHQGYSGSASGPPPPHVLPGMMSPMHQGIRGGPPQQAMMYPPPHQLPQFQQPQQLGAGAGGRSGMMSMGGNAGADLMALLNSGGNGGMRIGGQGPLPGHLQAQQHAQQGNLPPFLMEGR